MPAEWEQQEAVWLAWPHNPETWPGSVLEDVRESYARIVGILSADQAVRVLADDPDAEAGARSLLGSRGVGLSSVSFLQVPTCDTWIRDYGPTFVVNDDRRRLAMVVWEFNAWGGKYEDLLGDNGIPALLNAQLGLEAFEAGLVLEGGSIEVNGRGLVLTTEQCMLHSNRNPRLGRGDLDTRLHDYLGAPEVLWLGEGIAGDDTDGHVDDIARFVSPDTVVCCLEPDPADVNHRALRDNYERLTRFRDRSGKGLRVVVLPMPRPVIAEGERLPASYANFYIGNRSVVVPVFDDPNDGPALETLRGCFPGRRVVGVDSRSMIRGLGAIHCCTQQQPAL